MHVEPAWIDYNGHLNMAYYNVLFDRAVDEAFERLGCGLEYARSAGIPASRRRRTCAICASCARSAPVRVTLQLLDYDSKRMHFFEQLLHADAGWVSATSENMVASRQEHGRQAHGPLSHKPPGRA